jgi:hypothetical protein
MNLTGNINRFFSACESGTFLFRNVKTNALQFVSGATTSGKELKIGFTGITGSSQWAFTFQNGKIYDPDNRSFGAYDSDDYNTISGNFSKDYYNYYLNSELICSNGTRDGRQFNGWFNTVSGDCSGQADILVYTNTLDTEIRLKSGFYLGKIWSGQFHNNHYAPIVIRSGELLLTDSQFFTITGTGLDFLSGKNVVPSGGYRTFQISHTGSQDRTGQFILGVRVYTDFGTKYVTSTGMGLPTSSGFIGNSLSVDITGDINVTGNGLTGEATWYFSSSYISHGGQSLSKPFYVSASYVSGYTGSLYYPTGIKINNSGRAYTSSPLIYVNPYDSYVSSGSGILVGTGVSSISWVNQYPHTGLTGSYNLVFTGGGGSGASGSILWGSGYTKSFTGQLSLFTGMFSGANSGLICNKIYNIYSGSGIMTSGEELLFMKVYYVGTKDNYQMQYKITASGLADSVTFLTAYSGFGLVYKT